MTGVQTCALPIYQDLLLNLQDFGILDLLREISDELTIADFIDFSEVKSGLTREEFKLLKEPEIFVNLVKDLGFSSTFELFLGVSNSFEYRVKMEIFFSKINELQKVSNKLSGLLYRKLDGIIQQEALYSRTYHKVRNRIWDCFASDDFLKQVFVQNEKYLRLILLNIINYHTTIIHRKGQETSKYDKESEFQHHLLDYLSRPDRIGSQNIYYEIEKSTGKVDLNIFEIPIELKLIKSEKTDYIKYIEEKVNETKQYIVNSECNLGFLIILDATSQRETSEADFADYYEPRIVFGGRKKETDKSKFPIGLIVIHILGGDRTAVSRITK